MVQLNQLMNNCLKNYQLQEEKGDLEKVKGQKEKNSLESTFEITRESTLNLAVKQVINMP